MANNYSSLGPVKGHGWGGGGLAKAPGGGCHCGGKEAVTSRAGNVEDVFVVDDLAKKLGEWTFTHVNHM